MPTVPYLNGGEELTAARMNTLTEEASRRADICTDGHSILYLINESGAQSREDFAPYLGPVFVFGSPSTFSSYFSRAAYDHSVFTSALASAVEYSGSAHALASEPYKWVRINPLPASRFTAIGRIKSNGNTDWRMTPSLLRFSLEAHRRLYTKADGSQEMFWIQETFDPDSDTSGTNAHPIDLIRIHTMHQAEIVFDGVVSSLDFPYAWNRYMFFRFHNVTAAPVTVRFKGANGDTEHTVAVPARASQCVRRTIGTGTFPFPDTWAYTDGYAHFQKFLPGDPRFYQHRAGTTYGANNVVNPSIIIPFVNRLLAGMVGPSTSLQAHRICSPTAFLDHTVRAPLPDGDPLNTEDRPYADLYASPEDDAILGDCLHCKGTFMEVRTSLTTGITVVRKAFNGYGSLAAIDGLTVQEVGDDLQIKGALGGDFQDLIALTTNFFSTPGLSRSVADVTDWHTLDRNCPAVPDCKVEEAVTSSVVSYNQVGTGGSLGPAVNQTLTRTTIQFTAAPEDDTPAIHRHTVEDAKERYFGQSQNAHSTFTSTFAASSSGLYLYSTQTIDLQHPFRQSASVGGWESELGSHFSGNIIDPSFQPSAVYGNGLVSWDFSGTVLTVTRTLVFTGYGFPDVDNIPFPSINSVGDTAAIYHYTGFLTPRLTRMYSDGRTVGALPVSLPHPDFIEGEQNVDGRDVVYVGDGAAFRELGVRLPTPMRGQDYHNGVIGKFNNPDVLFGAVGNVELGTGYWNALTGNGPVTNRMRCAANEIYYNVPTDGSDFLHAGGFPQAQGFYRFVRMEMAAEHYNNLAAKVNSITKVKRLNWIDHGLVHHPTDPEAKFRLRPNSYGIFDKVLTKAWYAALSQVNKLSYLTSIHQYAGMRPTEQYAAESADAATVAGYAGIPLKTKADLPSASLFGATGANAVFNGTLTGFGEDTMSIEGLVTQNVTDDDALNFTTDTVPLRSALNRFTRLHTIAVDRIEFIGTTTEQATGLLRPDLNSIDAYSWIAIPDVEAYAQANGYRFTPPPRIGVGCTLAKLNLISGEPEFFPAAAATHRIRERFLYWPNFTPSTSQLCGDPNDLPQSAPIESFVIRTGNLGSLTKYILEFIPGGDWIADGRAIEEVEPGPDVLRVGSLSASSSAASSTALAAPKDWQIWSTPPSSVDPSTQPGWNQQIGQPLFGGIISAHSVSFDGVGPQQGFRVLFTISGIPPYNLERTADPFSVLAVLQADLEPETRARLWPKPLLDPTTVIMPSRNPADWSSALLCEEAITPEIAEPELIRSEVPALLFTEDFSETSQAAASARRNFGTAVLPFTVGTGQRVQLWVDFTEAVS